LAVARHTKPEIGGKTRSSWQRGCTKTDRVIKPGHHRQRVIASSDDKQNTDTQSRVRHAGTRPAVENQSKARFSPTMLLSIAGNAAGARCRAHASGTSPAQTATADPELDPPGINRRASDCWYA